MVTPVQQRIYHFVDNFIQEKGHSPSLEEIALGIGISATSISLVSRSIHALVAAGRLRFHKKGYRNIEVVQEEKISLPLLGKIAAGVPIEAIENKQCIDLGALLQGNGRFILQVQGDSMIDEGILDGDLVICKQTQTAHEGDIVVALIDEQDATLKRLSYQIPERITLIPANVALKPKAYLPHRVQIQGVYVGLLRMNK